MEQFLNWELSPRTESLLKGGMWGEHLFCRYMEINMENTVCVVLCSTFTCKLYFILFKKYFLRIEMLLILC